MLCILMTITSVILIAFIGICYKGVYMHGDLYGPKLVIEYSLPHRAAFLLPSLFLLQRHDFYDNLKCVPLYKRNILPSMKYLQYLLVSLLLLSKLNFYCCTCILFRISAHVHVHVCLLALSRFLP